MEHANNDHAALAYRALESWPALHSRVVDMKGRSIIGDLGPEPDRERRLVEFRFLQGGSWVVLGAGAGASGRNVIDLIAWLGNCDRNTAADYLRDALKRIDADAPPRSAA